MAALLHSGGLRLRFRRLLRNPVKPMRDICGILPERLPNCCVRSEQTTRDYPEM
jgi:hypothetical protein